MSLQARLEVVDLFTDLSDGKMLLKLLEIISGEKLGKPNNGRMRVHKVENVNKSLAFLHTKVINDDEQQWWFVFFFKPGGIHCFSLAHLSLLALTRLSR